MLPEVVTVPAPEGPLRLRCDMTIDFFDVPSRRIRFLCFLLGHRLRLIRSRVVSHVDLETKTIVMKDGPEFYPYCHRCHQPLTDQDRVR